MSVVRATGDVRHYHDPSEASIERFWWLAVRHPGLQVMPRMGSIGWTFRWPPETPCEEIAESPEPPEKEAEKRA